MWRCSNKLFCTEERWAHPDGRPIGLPADQDTKQARIVAHTALDNLQRLKGMGRQASYRWIQQAMGLSKEQAHIGLFDKPTCLRLIDLIYEELDAMAFPDLFSEDSLAALFDHHAPKDEATGLAHQAVRAACKDAARTIGIEAPACPEKTLAMRHLQYAMMMANSAIAQHGANPKGDPSAPPPPG